MKSTDALEPNWASPPGETIKDLMKRRGLSADEVAREAGIATELFEDILSGAGKLTRPLAASLSDILGGTAQFWVRREQQYREDVTRRRLLVEASDHEWTAELPISELINLRWVPQVEPKARFSAALSYFGVGSIEEWRSQYRSLVAAVSFRTSPIFSSHLGAVLAWLRQGQVQAARMELDRWDRAKLQRIIPEMRELTRNKAPRLFMPKLQRLCASAGVAVVVAQAPKGCRASGATWMSEKNPILLLSHRYHTDDQFWFSFFHEVGHLVLHSDRAIFLENGDPLPTDEEGEADRFAQAVLIPDVSRAALAEIPRTYKGVIKSARALGISPGILVGQLQHEKLLPPSWLNAAKRSFVW